MVTVRCRFISFRQNDDIVHFRSFQSIVRSNERCSHGNDFLPLKFDQGIKVLVQTGQETNNNVNKCIKHKR